MIDFKLLYEISLNFQFMLRSTGKLDAALT